jgi:hypothetical protein
MGNAIAVGRSEAGMAVTGTPALAQIWPNSALWQQDRTTQRTIEFVSVGAFGDPYFWVLASAGGAIILPLGSILKAGKRHS